MLSTGIPDQTLQTNQGFVHHLCFHLDEFIQSEIAEHPVRNITNTVGSTHTELHAGEVFRTAFRHDAANSVMSAMAPAGSGFHLAERNIDVIVQNDHIFNGDLIKAQSLGYGSAAEVHERLRLDQQTLDTTDRRARKIGIKLAPLPAPTSTGQNLIKDQKPSIVPGFLVLVAWIAQPYDELQVRPSDLGVHQVHMQRNALHRIDLKFDHFHNAGFTFEC